MTTPPSTPPSVSAPGRFYRTVARCRLGTGLHACAAAAAVAV